MSGLGGFAEGLASGLAVGQEARKNRQLEKIRGYQSTALRTHIDAMKDKALRSGIPFEEDSADDIADPVANLWKGTKKALGSYDYNQDLPSDSDIGKMTSGAFDSQGGTSAGQLELTPDQLSSAGAADAMQPTPPAQAIPTVGGAQEDSSGDVALADGGVYTPHMKRPMQALPTRLRMPGIIRMADAGPVAAYKPLSGVGGQLYDAGKTILSSVGNALSGAPGQEAAGSPTPVGDDDIDTMARGPSAQPPPIPETSDKDARAQGDAAIKQAISGGDKGGKGGKGGMGGAGAKAIPTKAGEAPAQSTPFDMSMVDWTNAHPDHVDNFSTEDWAKTRARSVLDQMASGKSEIDAEHDVNKTYDDMQHQKFIDYAQQALVQLESGNTTGAAANMKAAYQYFPNGEHARFGVVKGPDGTPHIIAQGVDEKTGQPTGTPQVVNGERLQAYIDNFKNQGAFLQWTKDRRQSDFELRKMLEVEKPFYESQAAVAQAKVPAEISELYGRGDFYRNRAANVGATGVSKQDMQDQHLIAQQLRGNMDVAPGDVDRVASAVILYRKMHPNVQTLTAQAIVTEAYKKVKTDPARYREFMRQQALPVGGPDDSAVDPLTGAMP